MDLSTDAFMRALEQVVWRRGMPAKVFSDNGSNFAGASKSISNEVLEEWAHSRGFSWEFIPARSPHRGGLWEAAVKAGKKLFKNAVKGQVLNYDEYATILSRVEAIMNSRPLCRVRVAEDYEPLTPAHFLIGTALNEIPLVEVRDMKLTRR